MINHETLPKFGKYYDMPLAEVLKEITENSSED